MTHLSLRPPPPPPPLSAMLASYGGSSAGPSPSQPVFFPHLIADFQRSLHSRLLSVVHSVSTSASTADAPLAVHQWLQEQLVACPRCGEALHPPLAAAAVAAILHQPLLSATLVRSVAVRTVLHTAPALQCVERTHIVRRGGYEQCVQAAPDRCNSTCSSNSNSSSSVQVRAVCTRERMERKVALDVSDDGWLWRRRPQPISYRISSSSTARRSSLSRSLLPPPPSSSSRPRSGGECTLFTQPPTAVIRRPQAYLATSFPRRRRRQQRQLAAESRQPLTVTPPRPPTLSAQPVTTKRETRREQ